MKIYSTPTLSGIISDDFLYFEGTPRPQSFFALRDDGEVKKETMIELGQYWNDVYNLFLRKLTLFAGTEKTSTEETLKLQALLQELITTRNLIENGGKADIMGR